MVARFDRCDTLTHGFDNSRAFVAQNYRKCTFWVLAGESVRIFPKFSYIRKLRVGCVLFTRMADASVVYLYPYFMSLGCLNLDVLDREVLSCLPGYCSLKCRELEMPSASFAFSYQ